MKRLTPTLLLIAVLAWSTSCNPSGSGNASDQADSTNTGAAVADETTQPADTALVASLQAVSEAPSLKDSLIIRFTVTNPTPDSLKFTTYHTPFEGLISKFLTVKDSAGKEVSYQGPMAKRVMPPPAETYRTLGPGESKGTTFDLKKCYKIDHPGTYTLQYNAERISGIGNGQALTITVTD